MPNNKITAIHQPHYFPWIPYVNKIAASDLFILFDTVQLPRGKSPVLRAKYLDPKGQKWLSIPYGGKSSLIPIRDVKLKDLSWKKTHLDKLKNAYKKAPHFEWALDMVSEVLESNTSPWLVDIEQSIIDAVCRVCGIKTRLVRASELLPLPGSSPQEYVLSLLEETGSKRYLSGRGRGSRKTVDEAMFKERGIELMYQDFEIPPYGHLHEPEFNPGVSILDALFMLGEKAKEHVR